MFISGIWFQCHNPKLHWIFLSSASNSEVIFKKSMLKHHLLLPAVLACTKNVDPYSFWALRNQSIDCLSYCSALNFSLRKSWVWHKTASSCDTLYECGNVRLPSITVTSPPSGLWICHNLGGRARRQSSTDWWFGVLAIVVWQTSHSL